MRKVILGISLSAILTVSTLLAGGLHANAMEVKPLENGENEICLYNINGEEYNTSGIMCGIDAVKSDGTGYNTETKLANPVFTKGFIADEISNHSLINTGVNTANSCLHESHLSSNIEIFNSSVSETINLDVAGGGKSLIFQGSVNNSFFNSKYEIYQKYLKTYLYHSKSQYNRYILSIDNTLDKDLFRENLSSLYVNELNRYFNGTLSYSSLFSEFGTHIMTEAIYGGIAQIDYRIATNVTVANSSIEEKIKNIIDLAIWGKESINVLEEIKSIYREYTNTELSNIDVQMRAICSGGETPYTPTLSSYRNSVNEWLETINNQNSAITNISGLVPLWEILPNELNTSKNVNKMIEDFKKYSNDVNSGLDDIKKIGFENLNEATLYDVNFRAQQYLITDKDCSENPYDIVDFNKYGIDVENDLYHNGFNKIEVNMKFKAYEKYDGYQEIYGFLKESSTENDENLFYKELEIGGKGVESNSQELNINFYINVRDLVNNHGRFYIKYGAHGYKGDDWYISNIKFKFNFIR